MYHMITVQYKFARHTVRQTGGRTDEHRDNSATIGPNERIAR